MTLPREPGDYTLEAELLSPPKQIKHPVISAWDIRVIRTKVPEVVANSPVFIPEDEEELRRFADQNHLKVVSEIDSARAILAGAYTWKRITGNDEAFKSKLGRKVDQGISVVLLGSRARRANVFNKLQTPILTPRILV